MHCGNIVECFGSRVERSRILVNGLNGPNAELEEFLYEWKLQTEKDYSCCQSVELTAYKSSSLGLTKPGFLLVDPEYY